VATNEKLIVQVVWGPRPETAAECADRWLDTQRRLAAVAPDLLGRWVRLEETDEGLAEIDLTDVDTLRRLVAAGAPPGPPRPELGFTFSSSTGRRGGPGDTFFTASAGLYTGDPNLLNQARLEVYPGPPEDEPRWRALGGPALLALVAAWEPDHGAVTGRSLRRAQPAGPREPRAGYLTYLCAGRRAAVPANRPGRVAGTPDGGVLLAATAPGGGRPGPDEVAAVGAALRAAGAFTPVPTDRPVT
jgi:hypothetical protein